MLDGFDGSETINPKPDLVFASDGQESTSSSLGSCSTNLMSIRSKTEVSAVVACFLRSGALDVISKTSMLTRFFEIYNV